MAWAPPDTRPPQAWVNCLEWYNSLELAPGVGDPPAAVLAQPA